jgi:hypothetical protein
MTSSKTGCHAILGQIHIIKHLVVWSHLLVFTLKSNMIDHHRWKWKGKKTPTDFFNHKHRFHGNSSYTWFLWTAFECIMHAEHFLNKAVIRKQSAETKRNNTKKESLHQQLG